MQLLLLTEYFKCTCMYQHRDLSNSMVQKYNSIVISRKFPV